MKTLFDISWQVDEHTYREDPALSQSTLGRYDREGFSHLDSLFDKLETPSLLFGSVTDSLVTGGMEEFNERFLVADYKMPSDAVAKIVKNLFDKWHLTCRTIHSITDEAINEETILANYGQNWRLATRVEDIRKKGNEYYDALQASQDKVVIDNNTYNDALRAVDALKTSSATSFYFQTNNPFEPDWFREYQLKFKHTFDGVDYRGMLDLCLTSHKDKIIYPIDLKTSGKAEWDFYKSFIEFGYGHQARLYYRLLEAAIKEDDFYKDYKIANYRFIVVNRKTLTPLVWEYPDTKKYGLLTYGKNKQIEIKDPFTLGKELNYYLTVKPKVPNNIDMLGENNLNAWLNEM